jgi:HEAT repeat protein
MAKELSLPVLIACLKSPDWAERFHAAFTLGQMGRSARKAVPALIETLKDADLHVRKAAVLALGDLGPDARDAVHSLCGVLLHDKEPTIRRRAGVALGEIGAEEAVPALQESASHDDNKGVREMVAAILVEINVRPLKAAA